MDGSFGPQRETVVGFEPKAPRKGAVHTAPDLDRPTPLPEPEWSLSAAQVALIVAAIVAFCEVIGALV